MPFRRFDVSWVESSTSRPFSAHKEQIPKCGEHELLGAVLGHPEVESLHVPERMLDDPGLVLDLGPDGWSR